MNYRATGSRVTWRARSGCGADHREPRRTRGAALLRRHSTATLAAAVAAVPAVAMTTFVVTTAAAAATAAVAYILLRDASLGGNRSARTRFSSGSGRRRPKNTNAETTRPLGGVGG